jgi:hypothetical protein
LQQHNLSMPKSFGQRNTIHQRLRSNLSQSNYFKQNKDNSLILWAVKHKIGKLMQWNLLPIPTYEKNAHHQLCRDGCISQRS